MGELKAPDVVGAGAPALITPTPVDEALRNQALGRILGMAEIAAEILADKPLGTPEYAIGDKLKAEITRFNTPTTRYFIPSTTPHKDPTLT